jgi:hypothetical protein
LLMVLIYQKKHIGISGTKYQLVISGEIQRLTFGETFSAEWIITGKLYNMYNRNDLWQKGDFFAQRNS